MTIEYNGQDGYGPKQFFVPIPPYFYCDGFSKHLHFTWLDRLSVKSRIRGDSLDFTGPSATYLN